MALDQEKFNIQEIADKWVLGSITETEKEFFDVWYQSFNDEQAVIAGSKYQAEALLKQKILQHIQSRVKSQQRPLEKKLHYNYRLMAAVVAIAILSVAGWFYHDHQRSTIEFKIAGLTKDNDVVPGKNVVLLTLSDGKHIALTGANNGIIAAQKGSNLVKTGAGTLVYENANEDQVRKADHVAGDAYNTISTPAGTTYQVSLPDGTKVWLNAASSLTYPTAFYGAQRQVELQGEAYFEVAKNKEKPFLVIGGGQQVKVLGTHFNINSYTGEGAIETTLLEGAVALSQVNKANMSIILKPGQQASLQQQHFQISEADIGQTMAWKDGLFLFENADLATVMRQIARWYDLEIVYQGAIPKSTFDGKISRKLKLSKVLEVFKYYKMNFRIEGKKLTVIP